FWGLSAALILGAIRLGPPPGGFREAVGPMMLSFVPIAAGYHVAHYLVALLTDGQYAIAALNDPFGNGRSLLGLPDHWVSFGFLATQSGVLAVWTAQFTAIVVAHVLAVLLSFRLSGNPDHATTLRAHVPLTLLMLAYTVSGVCLLSAPTGS